MHTVMLHTGTPAINFCHSLRNKIGIPFPDLCRPRLPLVWQPVLELNTFWITSVAHSNQPVKKTLLRNLRQVPNTTNYPKRTTMKKTLFPYIPCFNYPFPHLSAAIINSHLQRISACLIIALICMPRPPLHTHIVCVCVSVSLSCPPHLLPSPHLIHTHTRTCAFQFQLSVHVLLLFGLDFHADHTNA